MSHDPGARRRLGRTDVEVSVLGLGCAPLGNLFQAVTDDVAAATLAEAHDVGIRLFDTAPLYGSGLSENRVGAARRAGDVIATKVGRRLDAAVDPDPMFVDVPPSGPVFDFSSTGVEAALAESERRLGGPVDVCWVHDPDDHPTEARRDALPRLRALRDSGRIRAVGLGMNQTALPSRAAEAGEVDALLVAGRWNLLDQSALDDLLPAVERTGVGLVIGGVYASGLLADPDAAGATYAYAPAAPDIRERARAIAARCRAHGVDLAVAAMHLPLLHPAVTAVVVGARRPAEVRIAADALRTEVPGRLWTDLVDRRLLPTAVADLVDARARR
jgi:D-threo-aldose 1-dehydrogenase